MKLDYNKPITKENIPESFFTRYKSKFKEVDEFLKMKPKDDKELNKLKIKMHDFYKDPTTFAYMLLSDDSNESLELYFYQDLILNDPHRFIYFRASNQIGKSFSFNVKAVHNLLIDHGHTHNEAIVSKSLPQSLSQMRRIKAMLNKLEKHVKIKEATGMADSMSVFTLDMKDAEGNIKYTNTLICAPCTEGLLGYDLHEENLDEFEYWDEDQRRFYNQIGEPRTYKTKGRIFIMSNPNGGTSYGAELEKLTLPDGTKKFHTYVFNFLDCPGNTEEDLILAKVGKTRQQIESTLMAIRSTSDINYLSPDEIEKSYDPNLKGIDMIGHQPFFFLDVGAKHDQACLVGGFVKPHQNHDVNGLMEIFIPIIHLYPVGYPISRVAGVDQDDSDGWHYEKSVKDYLKEWSKDGTMPTFGYDITGNQGMKALFESMNILGEDVTFSGPSKSGMYQRYKYFMEIKNGLLHRIKHEEWEKQAADLIVTKSQRGYLLINSAGVSHGSTRKDASALAAKLKKIPDDTQDATVGLIYLADNPDAVNYSMAVI